jgi:hypothetical protein
LWESCLLAKTVCKSFFHHIEHIQQLLSPDHLLPAKHDSITRLDMLQMVAVAAADVIFPSGARIGRVCAVGHLNQRGLLYDQQFKKVSKIAYQLAVHLTPKTLHRALIWPYG